MREFAAQDDRDLKEAPGRYPRYVPSEGYGRALRISFAGHAALILFVIIKSLVFPGSFKPYVPTLRVDMVDLPDVLKKDLQNLPATQSSKEIAEALKAAERDAKKIKPVKLPDKPVERAAPDEMVLKPKHAEDAPEKPLKREKSMKSALDRIKALAKIENETRKETPARGAIVKGNKISKGTSLSGDAKEAAEASYYDALRSKLQENWELPVWIARQNLDAQVRVYIDAYGRVRNYRFMKASGNAQFDSAIKRTLEESQPFPKPPEELASSLLTDGILVGFPL